jgi:hypothetical protein
MVYCHLLRQTVDLQALEVLLAQLVLLVLLAQLAQLVLQANLAQLAVQAQLDFRELLALQAQLEQPVLLEAVVLRVLQVVRELQDRWEQLVPLALQAQSELLAQRAQQVLREPPAD